MILAEILNVLGNHDQIEVTDCDDKVLYKGKNNRILNWDGCVVEAACVANNTLCIQIENVWGEE